MESLLIFLVKAAAIQFMLMLFYVLLLRRDTFYKATRLYFLIGLALSFVIPLVGLSAKGLAPGMIVDIDVLRSLLSETATTQAARHSFPIGSYLTAIAMAVSLVMLIRSVRDILRIYRLPYTKCEQINGIRIKYVTTKIHPFSFGRTIYLNDSLHTSGQLDEIIRHETVHICQWHTADIVLVALNRCLFWWNPASWMLSASVRGNLEYIVDRRLIDDGVDRKSYQYNLLSISQLAYSNSFNNNFSLFNLKNRIQMMNKSATKRIYAAKWIAALPLALALVCFIGCAANSSTENAEVKAMPDTEILSVTGVTEMNLDLEPFPMVRVDGKEITKAEFDAINPNDIESISVLKDKTATATYGEKGKNGVLLITMKK